MDPRRAGRRNGKRSNLSPGTATSNQASFTLSCTTPSATATASVSPASYTGGACPAVFTFSGTVTSPSAGTVTYRWTRSDGATGPTSTLTFTGAGSQTVSTTWTLGAAGTTGTFWEAVQILSPGTATSNQASFTLSCTTPSATATASVSPASYTGGACPAVFTFSGTVTSRAGTVTYRWTRSDGATGPTSTLTFTGAGSQTVSTTWTLGAAGTTGTFWEAVQILSPGTATSNQASFTLSCT